MNREDCIQQIIENSSQLKRLALADRSVLGSLQLSRAQLELVHLLFFHNQLSVKQAASLLGVSLSAVSQLADSLKSEGYITRDNDDQDRRIIYMSLTPRGREVIKEVRNSLTSGLRAILETLSDKEIDALSRIYKKMLGNAATLKNQTER